jgi:phage protein D
MSSGAGPAYSPRFKITVGGEIFTEANGIISDVIADTTVEGADYAAITFRYPWDTEQRTFEGLEQDTFDLGTDLKISMGYGDTTPEQLFVGTVDSVRPEFPAEGGPTVLVSGYGLLHGMMRGTNSQSWEETTLESIVTDVAGETFSSSNITIEGASMQLTKIIQDKQSDYRFLEALAERYGFEFFARLDSAYFRPGGGESVSAEAATLEYGSYLYSFAPELSDSAQVAEVEVRHWDPTQGAEIVGSATNEAVDTGKHVLRTPVDSQEDAEKVATATVEGMQSGLLYGSGEARGDPAVNAGTTVALTGLGERFSQTYYVTHATHRMGQAGYTLSFEVVEVPS